jgi:hypothetical protein
MKKVMLTVLFFAVSCGSSPSAFSKVIAPEGYYVKMSPGMFQPTEEQAFDVKNLSDKQKRALHELFGSKDGKELSAAIERTEAIKSEEAQAVSKILTKEQLVQATESPLHRFADHEEFSALTVKGLTNDQRIKLHSVFAPHAEELNRIRMRAGKIRGDQGQAVEKILTTAQLAELQHKANKADEASK